jgi:SSS family solute:Na+ symporter
MAAAMSTADSNLHAMSALLTRDVYDRFIRPQASQQERTWIGRGIIGLATLVALALVILGQRSEHNPLGMIVILGLLAIAFATQLLPITLDMLFLRRGTREGAIGGIVTGLTIVFFLSPFFSMFAGNTLQSTVLSMKKMMDTGAWGFMANALVFAGISLWTRHKE